MKSVTGRRLNLVTLSLLHWLPLKQMHNRGFLSSAWVRSKSTETDRRTRPCVLIAAYCRKSKVSGLLQQVDTGKLLYKRTMSSMELARFLLLFPRYQHNILSSSRMYCDIGQLCVYRHASRNRRSLAKTIIAYLDQCIVGGPMKLTACYSSASPS